MKVFYYFVFILTSFSMFSQNTQGFSYQSTIRNTNNQLVINQYISLKFTIRLNSTVGTVIYSEIQHPYSNNNGNVDLIIGKGIATIGTFSTINWAAGTHYLGIEFFTGTSSCQWITVPTGANGQIVSYCSGIYTLGSCTPTFANLVWSDEFDGTGAINTNNWFHQTQLPAGGSWFNSEIQHYTNRQVNSNVANGLMSIVAKKEVFTDQGQTKQFTSARLNSKFAFQYGRVEVRAKMPIGVGTFPAIWMLGKNIIEPGSFWTSTNGTVNWPACGEIDIIEHWGTNQNFVQSALHTPSSYGNTSNLGGQVISNASSQFHTYVLEWTAEKMVFSVDNIVHYTYNPAVKDANTWPFNSPQYILLNVAMLPSVTNTFTQSAMEIDYVRVYQ